MVCLNKNISIEKIKFRDNLLKNVINKINKNFYLHELNQLKIESNLKSEITFSIIDNVNKLIKEEIKDLFSNDHFIYVNMDNSVCTHKFKKGKKEGYFCQKKIKTNILNGEKDYLCVKHSKLHMPNKRIKKYIKSTNNITIETFYNNNILEKKIIKDVKKINKNNYKRKKRNIKNKIIIHGVINFKDIINKLLT